MGLTYGLGLGDIFADEATPAQRAAVFAKLAAIVEHLSAAAPESSGHAITHEMSLDLDELLDVHVVLPVGRVDQDTVALEGDLASAVHPHCQGALQLRSAAWLADTLDEMEEGLREQLELHEADDDEECAEETRALLESCHALRADLERARRSACQSRSGTRSSIGRSHGSTVASISRGATVPRLVSARRLGRPGLARDRHLAWVWAAWARSRIGRSFSARKRVRGSATMAAWRPGVS